MIINPINGNSGAGVPLQNPGSGTPGGQMPMGMRPQMGINSMGAGAPMGQPPPQAPTFNAPGQGGFGANGQNVFGQNQQQAQRAQMMGQINNGTFGIRTGAPSQQDLVKQYAMAQQLRGANWRG